MTKAIELTPRQEEIRSLIEDTGLSPADAAKRLNISANAVYQQIRRMRKAGIMIAVQGAGQRSPAVPKTRPPLVASLVTPPSSPSTVIDERRRTIAATLKRNGSEAKQLREATDKRLAQIERDGDHLRAEDARLEAAALALSGKLKKAAPRKRPKRQPKAETTAPTPPPVEPPTPPAPVDTTAPPADGEATTTGEAAAA